MLNKKFAIVAVIAVLIIAGSAGAISYAVWDNNKPSTKVEIDAGVDSSISVKDLQFTETNRLVPVGKSFMKENESVEIVAAKFQMQINNLSGAKYKITYITMYDPKQVGNDNIEEKDIINIDCMSFMSVTLIEGARPISNDEILIDGQTIEVKIKFSVDSSNDLLTTEMSKYSVKIGISLSGVNLNE